MRLRRGKPPPQPGAGEEMLERCWMLEMLEMLEASSWGTNTEDGERSRGPPHREERLRRGEQQRQPKGRDGENGPGVFLFVGLRIASPTPCKSDQLGWGGDSMWGGDRCFCLAGLRLIFTQ